VPAVVGADASYVVLSGSMEPTISAGDAVVVNSVDPASIESGDVITYTRAGESTPVTHRVVEVVEGEDGLAFRTKGDANDAADAAPVPADNVTGEVWFAIPLVGHVVLFANTPTGLATLVGFPITAFVLSELYTFVRDSGSDDAGAPTDSGAEADTAGAEEPMDGADTGDATEESATADEPTDSDGAVALTAMDVKLSSIGFIALAVYSGYMAYVQMTPVRVAIFTGAALVVVFLGTVLLFGTADAESTEQSVEDAAADRPEGAATDGGHRGDSASGGDDDDD
jgi:signal peptidase